MSKRLHFFGLRFLLLIILTNLRHLLYIYGFEKSRTKKVECFCKVQTNINDVGGKRRYNRNILQWSKIDFKSRISTNGDYCPPFLSKFSEIKCRVAGYGKCLVVLLCIFLYLDRMTVLSVQYMLRKGTLTSVLRTVSH